MQPGCTTLYDKMCVWGELCVACVCVCVRKGVEGSYIFLQSLVVCSGGSQGKLILFSGASTRVKGLTAHYSGPWSSLFTPWWMAHAAWRRYRWGAHEGEQDGHQPYPSKRLLRPTVPLLLLIQSSMSFTSILSCFTSTVVRPPLQVKRTQKPFFQPIAKTHTHIYPHKNKL